ncbi:tetratricopeptide repeat protein [Aggregatimonas sangjinii]|uniref:Tetratricopeptide repeat protein n=1 Tax=Aggregatimonas sangjinii TaxID=2583587 RepID=A0A5B7SV23_9FLAO|nr:SH3 domain-containing protein [Aggregatimonas sangjinii]QCX02062.1 tetratricopeptide repeat protein [Aggregatimonas sangjinii]
MKRITFILILLIGLSAVGQNEALFEAANKAYNEGEYTASIAQYEKILEQGQHSAELYYNLGNAHYKLNQIAPSIYYYEKALLLKPNDPEIKNNLAYANNMTLDAIDTMPEMGFSKFYNRIVRWFTFDQWAYLGVFSMLLFVLLYIVFYFFHDATRKRIAFILSLIGLLVSIFAVAMAFVNYADFNSNQPAIVFDNEIAVRSEPNERGEGIFILHEGTKVNVLESLNGYQKIKIADGKTGWLPKESIKLLKDF